MNGENDCFEKKKEVFSAYVTIIMFIICIARTRKKFERIYNKEQKHRKES